MLLFLGIKMEGSLSGRLQGIRKRAPKKLEGGAQRATLRLADDALNLAPKPRIDTGLLRRSWAAFLGSRKIASGGGERAGFPDDDRFMGTVAFDTPYAAYQHELEDPVEHAKPEANQDAGPKYLESKLELYRDEYIQELIRDLLDPE